MQQLESDLGTRLLQRTTRRVGLTEAGQEMLQRIAPALNELDLALDAVRQHGERPRGHLRLTVPGIVAQTVLTTCMATGVQLREDMEKGVFDRFKSLPIARIAPLAGPMVADLVRYLIAAGLTFAMGMIIGYRPGGGVLGVAGAIVLAIFTGWAMAWIFTFIGTIARSARAVQGFSMMILFPLTFLSNAFVPVSTLPGPLAAFVRINPVSHLVSATRALANHAMISSEVGWTLLAGLAVMAIFAPLSVASYKRHI